MSAPHTGNETTRSSEPTVELTRAVESDLPVFTRLMQLYVHDLSDLVGMDIGEDGRFAFTPEQQYWTDPRYRPFFIRAGGKLAGFVVVDGVSRLTGEPVSDMSQFFVLRRARRGGVGTRAAHAVFEAFPGPWEVRQAPENLPAIAFWRRAIEAYTGGNFRDGAWERDGKRYQVQRFESSPRRESASIDGRATPRA